MSVTVTAICGAREMVSKGSWSEIVQIASWHQRIASARGEHHGAHWAEAAAIAAHSQGAIGHDHRTAIRRRYECHATGHHRRVVSQRAAINERFQINTFNVIHCFMCRWCTFGDCNEVSNSSVLNFQRVPFSEFERQKVLTCIADLNLFGSYCNCASSSVCKLHFLWVENIRVNIWQRI